MARIPQVLMVDDLDGRPIEEGEGGTVLFSFQGVDYEIDLRTTNVMKFEKAIDKFISSATRVGGRKRTVRSAPTGDANNLRAVRQWARENGYEISSKGRVPQDIMRAFSEAV
ncbi:Lsr2-like DNA bridging protein [Gordonia phage WilliamBoone]|nr:Lsr2-like DNA bridging protein [Gordonia phage WilliamBoone]